MITIWQVASVPFWCIAAFCFARSVPPVFNTGDKRSAERIFNRLLAAGIFACIAAKVAT